MNQTITKATVSVLLALVCLALFASSAQAVQIRAETGDALPSSIIVNENLTVLITDDEGAPINGVAESARVRYILPADDGNPIPVDVGSDGKTVNPYKPPMIGVLNITVSYGTTLMASQTVTVITPGIQTLGSITISPASPDPLNLGLGSLTFTAACNDTDGNVMICPTPTWYSSNTAVGTITEGEFTALAVGTTTITARADGVTSNEAVVTVNAPEYNETLSNETSFTIESGNATVTGNFSVNVSGDVAVQAVGNVTAHVPNATTVGLGAGYEFISGAIVNVSGDIHNALVGDNGTVTITLCVNDSMLDAMELARSNVQIYVYNEDAEWVGLTTNRVGTTDCHTADISGYLSEAIVAIASKPASTPPSSRGGGGGGGSGTYPPGWFTTPTPTVTATKAPAASTTATAATPGKQVTPASTKAKPTATQVTADEAEGTTAGTAKKSTSGFTAVFAIAGLLAVAYAIMRRRE